MENDYPRGVGHFSAVLQSTITPASDMKSSDQYVTLREIIQKCAVVDLIDIGPHLWLIFPRNPKGDEKAFQAKLAKN